MKIENEGVRVHADYDVGISLIEAVKVAQAKISFPKFSAHFQLRGRPVDLVFDRPDAVGREGSRISVLFSHKPDGRADKRVQAEVILSTGQMPGALVVEVALTNFTDEPIALDHVKVLDIKAGKKGNLGLGYGVLEWSFYKHGFQSFSSSGTLRVNERSLRPKLKLLRRMEENITNPASGLPGDHRSEQVTQITNYSSGQALLCGFTKSERTFGDIRLVVDVKKSRFVRLEARNHFDGVLLASGQTITTEPFVIAFGARQENLLTKWADRLGENMNARIPKKSASGWCSWYYYYTKITEDKVLSNLSKLSAMTETLPVDFVQVDDGYQARIGDWLETNKTFKSGMKDMASRIINAGVVPGIWTAPFYARPKSRLFREHREWFLHNSKGKPINGGWNPLWGGRVYALDATHPGAQKYLHTVYTTLYEMGYRYFKCDFLYAATLPAERHNPQTTRAQALRIGLGVIREAIGENSFLLGCGCPITAAVGIVDGMRIGMDVTPKWTSKYMRALLSDPNCLSTHHSIVNTINRAFMHNRLFANDPDCLIVRKDKNRMNLNEIKALATVIALSGGLLVFSDNMEKLPESRLDIIRKVYQYRTNGMKVHGQFRDFEPDVISAQTDRGVLFGLLNFQNKAVTKIFDLKELMSMEKLSAITEIRDVWSGRDIKHQNGLIRLGGMPPHSARLIELIIH